MKTGLFVMLYVAILGLISFGTLCGLHLYFRKMDRLATDSGKLVLFVLFLGCGIALPLWILSVLFSLYANWVGPIVRITSYVVWIAPALALCAARAIVGSRAAKVMEQRQDTAENDKGPNPD